PKVDVLRIGGFDDGVRGLFGIAVAGDYQFEACFPPTEYYIRFPQGFVKQTILARIPDGQPLVVRSVTQRAAETLPPASLHIVPKTRAAFVNDLPASVRLLGIGESNHG